MKHLFLLLNIFVLTISASASWKKNIIKIREAQGRKIMVTIDNKNFPKINNVITIGDVPTGTHYIKVFRAKQSKYGGYAQGPMIYKGVIKTNGGRIYRCTIDSYMGMNVQEFCCIGDNGNGYFGNDNNYYNNDWYDQEFDGNWNNNNMPPCMNNNQFNEFKNIVANQSFDNSKLTIIKQQLSNQFINAQQLKELVRLFTFEDNKLELVRFASPKVIDPQNLFYLYDEFTFDSNKRELADILSTLKPNNNWNNNGNNNNGWNNNNNWNNNNWGNDHHDDNWNNNNNWNNDNNNWNNNSNNNYNNNNGGYGSTMSNSSFAAFKQTVENSSFDSGKLKIIQQQIGSQWISSQQLKELIDLFTFESSKLDAAKAGAPRVQDKNNLYILYNSFTFENNKKELADFLKTLN